MKPREDFWCKFKELNVLFSFFHFLSFLFFFLFIFSSSFSAVNCICQVSLPHKSLCHFDRLDNCLNVSQHKNKNIMSFDVE